MLPLLLFAACASAAPEGRASAGAPGQSLEQPRRPLLWQVHGEGGPSYLFGTIHLGYDAHGELPPQVWDALSSCEAMVMEADLRAMSPQEIARISSLRDEASLPERLGEESWSHLVELLGGAARPAAIAAMRPWVAYSLALQALHPTRIPLDRALMERADAQQKDLLFLEDWRFQLETLDRITDISDLAQLVAPESEARAHLEAMVMAYRAGDFASVSALAHDQAEIASDPREYRLIFEERNRVWLPKLADSLNRRRTFVAVGVGHFSGPSGLLALLRDEGLEPRRV